MQGSSEMEDVLGGRMVEVYRAGGGESEGVRVRALSIRKLEQLLSLAGKEAEKAELYADKPEGWADTLTVESVEAVLEAGDRLNFTVLQRLRERRARETRALLQFLERAEGGAASLQS